MRTVRPNIRTNVRSFAEVRQALDRILFDIEGLIGEPGEPGRPGEPPEPTPVGFVWNITFGRIDRRGLYRPEVGDMVTLQRTNSVALPRATELNRGFFIGLKGVTDDQQNFIIVDDSESPMQTVDGQPSIRLSAGSSLVKPALILMSVGPDLPTGFGNEHMIGGWISFMDRDTVPVE